MNRMNANIDGGDEKKRESDEREGGRRSKALTSERLRWRKKDTKFERNLDLRLERDRH